MIENDGHYAELGARKIMANYAISAELGTREMMAKDGRQSGHFCTATYFWGSSVSGGDGNLRDIFNLSASGGRSENRVIALGGKPFMGNCARFSGG
jgi:hypothetical protein